MITKAIIKQLNTTEDNHCRVFIPLLKKANDVEENVILDATFTTISGIDNIYKVNDVVFVEFEDSEYNKPVIIGKLYTGKEDATNITTTVVAKASEVTTTSKLPDSTYLGNSDSDSLITKIERAEYLSEKCYKDFSDAEVSKLVKKADLDSAIGNAVEEANNYTDGNLNNYFTKTATANALAAGSYKFVKVIEQRMVTATLHPDSNAGIVETSLTATVTLKSVLWQNTQDKTYKIAVDVQSVAMSSCTMKPKAMQLVLTTFGSQWRFPIIWLSQIWDKTATQLQSWGVSSWWATNLTGGCFTDQSTNIGVVNGNGVCLPMFVGKAANSVSISTTLIELDTDHKDDNLPAYGFYYHFDILTNKTSL